MHPQHLKGDVVSLVHHVLFACILKWIGVHLPAYEILYATLGFAIRICCWWQAADKRRAGVAWISQRVRMDPRLGVRSYEVIWLGRVRPMPMR